MSEENVEVVRRVTEAMLHRNEDAFIDGCRPDVEWEENMSIFPGLRPVYRGHAAVREWFSDVTDTWSNMRVARADYLVAGDDRVCQDILVTTRGTASGVETSLRIWVALWLIDGKIARRKVFLDETEAHEAVGLSG